MDHHEHVYETVEENYYADVLGSVETQVNNKEELHSEEEKDFIEHYHTYDEAPFEPPEEPKHKYDFEKDSSASSNEESEEEQDPPKSPVKMADADGIDVDNLTLQEKENDVQTINKEGETTEKVIFLFIKPPLSEATTTDIQNTEANDTVEPVSKRPEPRIMLFTKAGSDRECIGCCPFSQRLFMMLWLKGVVFNVTTVDKATKPKQLSNIGTGANPPFLLFNGEELTDFQKCEDYIEAELYPPRYPKLACKHNQSNTAGNDIFAKFSAFIKFTGNKNDPKRKMLETKLNDALRKFDKYLNEPLDDEIDEDDDSDEAQISKRKFIDGDLMTIADCNMLPKLNMIRVAGKELLKYEIPEEFTGIARYLRAADETEEFVNTCPDPDEIVWTYGGRKPKPKKQ